MTEQLYKRITKIFAFVFIIAITAMVGANAAENNNETNNDAKGEATKAQPKSRAASFLNYDMVIGDKDAPIEIIEYASTTCPHCATFHKDVLPTLKKKYVKTGKVKIVFRNFVFTNPFDVFASTLNRCVSEKKFFPLLGLYFKRQQAWVKYKEFGELKPYGRYAALGFAKGEVIKIAKIAGMKEADAFKCLARPEVLRYLMGVNEIARTKYEVNSTPTVIVNGKKLDNPSLEAIEEAIQAAGN